MFKLFKEMLSESNASSCMRFCVVVVIVTIMGNYTILNIASLFKEGVMISMDIQDIISLLGVLGLKLGQKKMESNK